MWSALKFAGLMSVTSTKLFGGVVICPHPSIKPPGRSSPPADHQPSAGSSLAVAAMAGLDMALDDLIKQERPGKGGRKAKANGGRGSRKQSSAPYARGGGKGGGGGDAVKACNNCGVVGHLAGQCPDPPQCHACGSIAHAVAECPNKDKTCDVCGKTGHLKAKCRMEARKNATTSAPKEQAPKERVASAANKRCNNCGVVGHLAGQCPDPPQCHACGSTEHAVAGCPNRDKTCEICGKTGHTKAKCRSVFRA